MKNIEFLPQLLGLEDSLLDLVRQVLEVLVVQVQSTTQEDQLLTASQNSKENQTASTKASNASKAPNEHYCKQTWV